MGASDDRVVLDELSRVSDLGKVHDVSHYLYFPDEATSLAVAAELRNLGFPTTTRLGGDGVNWLVLVKQRIVPTEQDIGVARAVFEDLAARNSGEYDGWEAEVIGQGEGT